MDQQKTAQNRDTSAERRRETRRVTIRRCRIRGRRSLLFASGITQNCSEGGLLIGLPSPRHLTIGEEIEVVVAWDGDALVRANAAIRGRIVRIEDRPDEQRIAIALDMPAVQTRVNPVRIAA